MQEEKKVTLDDAMLVWWFITWRTILSTICIYIILLLIIKFTPLRTIAYISTLPLIISIFIQVLYLKYAINRNYKNFRLSATLLNNNQQNGEQQNKQ